MKQPPVPPRPCDIQKCLQIIIDYFLVALDAVVLKIHIWKNSAYRWVVALLYKHRVLSGLQSENKQKDIEDERNPGGSFELIVPSV